MKIAAPLQTWKEWVTLQLKRRRRKLHDGIPRNEFELSDIHDPSTFVDYCTKDVFKSFLPRPTTTSYLNERSKFCRATTAEKCEQYYTWLRDAGEYHNKNVDLDSNIRVPSSFPLSCSEKGEVLNYDLQSPKFTCDTITDSSIEIQTAKIRENICKSENSVDSINAVPTTDSAHHDKSKPQSSKTTNQNSDYVIYHSVTPSDERISGNWHESYAFLLMIVCDRVEMSAVHLQTYVDDLEHKIFQCEYQQLADQIVSDIHR